MTFSKQLKVIMERSSVYYMNKHIDKYTERLTSVTKQWRTWVRQQLSVAHIKGKQNKSLYPRLRSGDLRKSLVNSHVKVKKITKMRGGKGKAEFIIPVMFNKLKSDYGELLNSSRRFSNSTFFGWKDRVKEELIKRTKGRL